MNSTYAGVVIGGGPAGIIGAATAAALGANVALVDKSADLGGAGANTGTVPSKTLRETALAGGVDRRAAVSQFSPTVRGTNRTSG